MTSPNEAVKLLQLLKEQHLSVDKYVPYTMTLCKATLRMVFRQIPCNEDPLYAIGAVETLLKQSSGRFAEDDQGHEDF